jgi:hypothetical protein
MLDKEMDARRSPMSERVGHYWPLSWRLAAPLAALERALARPASIAPAARRASRATA